ncbi:hypothetical protein [Agrobacterium sp.]|uniref:hypothetical protein n=1 Tax=Agrobacterium sp. TaxID=361 RepID=UPI00289C7E8D|nr:hypothetical protein [Agrobacterium sp.]
MRRILAVTLLATMMASCQSAGVQHDQYTGKTIVHSERYSVNSGLLSNAHATAVWTNTAGYQVVFDYLGTGGSWMFFRQAWAGGKQFPYTVTSEKVLSCASGCTMAESGYFRLSEADFRQALTRGLAFKVMGSGGAVTGKLPPEAFKKVSELMKK